MTEEYKKRLIQGAAAMLAASEEKPVEFKNKHSDKWTYSPGLLSFDFDQNDYRPKPEPATRNWTPEDVPGLCWLYKGDIMFQYLIYALEPAGVWISCGRIQSLVTWSIIHEWKFSTDRINWKPCTVEVAP